MGQWRIKHAVGVELVELLQAVGHDAGVGVYLLALAQVLIVGAAHHVAVAAARFRVRHSAPAGAPQVVGLAVVVNEPGDLAGVAQGVGRRADRDEPVDAVAARLAQVQQPQPQGLVGKGGPSRVEGDAHRVHPDAAPDQFALQIVHDLVGAALEERQERGSNDDSHKSPFGGAASETRP